MKEKILKNILIGDYKDIDNINELIKSKDELFNLIFYLSNHNALNKEITDKLAKSVIKYKDPFYNFTYALEINVAPVEKLFYETVKLGNMRATKLFLDKFKNLDINIVINYLKTNGSVEDIITIIKKYPNIPREKLYKRILNGNAIDIYNFCRSGIINTQLNIFEDKIIELNDPQYLYLFIKDVKNANKERIGKAILKTYNSKYIYLFTREFNVLDEKEILKYLDSSTDIYYVYLYYRDNYRISLVNFLEYTDNIGELLYYLSYEDRLKYLVYLYQVGDKDKITLYKDYLLDKDINIKEGIKLDIEYKNKEIKRKKIRKL